MLEFCVYICINLLVLNLLCRSQGVIQFEWAESDRKSQTRFCECVTKRRFIVSLLSCLANCCSLFCASNLNILYFQIWMRLLIETVDENWHFYFSKKLSFTLNCYNKCSNRSAYMRHMRIQVINKKKFRILYISIFKLKPIYALLLLFITHRKKVWCYEWKYTREKYPITKFNGISIELHTA